MLNNLPPPVSILDNIPLWILMFLRFRVLLTPVKPWGLKVLTQNPDIVCSSFTWAFVSSVQPDVSSAFLPSKGTYILLLQSIISLLCSVSKFLEHVINDKYINVIIKSISKSQYGFLAKPSSLKQLLTLLGTIHQDTNRKPRWMWCTWILRWWTLHVVSGLSYE